MQFLKQTQRDLGRNRHGEGLKKEITLNRKNDETVYSADSRPQKKTEEW